MITQTKDGFVFNCCGCIVELNYFRLYDPDKRSNNQEKHFYRYEQCFNCKEEFKIEVLTQIGRLSGARYYDFERDRFEDFDFCLRASKVGLKTFYNQDICIYHKGQGTTASVKDIQLFYHLQSRLLFVKKHFPTLQYLIISFLSLFVEPLTRCTLFLCQRNFSGIKNTLKGYLHLYKSMFNQT